MHDAAASWGLPDFVIPPNVERKGSGVREISDGLLVAGRRGIIMQTNRQLNKVIHTAAKTQIRLVGPGRDYYQRRRAEGKTNAEAIRALKRHITTAIYRTLQADAAAHASRRMLASEEDKRG